MLYQWYEMGHAVVRPARAAADTYRRMLANPFNPVMLTPAARHAVAALEVFERTTRRYDKPRFAITSTVVDGRQVAVTEEVVWQRPFCRLLRFRRDLPEARDEADPRLLLVAPMSGHFATLLRGTVETFLPNHDVYITDWQDARDVPLGAGAFDLDTYIDYATEMFRHFGGNVHVFAVCQPSVAVLAAVSRMEAEGDSCVPMSMTLAGGPIDTRRSPTVVNTLAEERGIEWFRRNVVTSVPWPLSGFGRRVYPGFLQLSGFMSMNLDRHVQAHKDLFLHLVEGDGDSAEKHCDFYDEYLAVMDLTAEFFLQTVERVFIRHELPRGVMTHRGVPIDPGRIRRVALFTIEGEKDDITGVGQCKAAHDLCTGILPSQRQHFECPGVGHYGVFNGSRFRSEIAPRIATFMRANDPRFAIDPKGGLSLRMAGGRMVRAALPSGDMSAAAFSFGPDNDEGPDPIVARVGKSMPPPPSPPLPLERGPLGMAFGAPITGLRLWSLAGSLMLDGMMRVHGRDRSV